MMTTGGPNQLVIKQTYMNHRIITEVFKALRKNWGAQISIETRLLQISNSFMQDIGLDLDFVFNLENAGYDINPETGALEQRVNPGPWNRTTPISLIQQSMGWAQAPPTNVPGSLGGGTAGTGFQISGSFLDNVQVDFLIRATQAHQRSRALDAPNVTVLNGQMANVQFGDHFNYISGWEAVIGIGAQATTPLTDVVDTSFTMMIMPYISTDKKHVFFPMMSIQQTALIELQTFVTRELVSDDPENPIIQELPVQLPHTKDNMITTSALVPDGGTLLLGGQKLVGETEREMGVPALSKVPILGRLFTNRNKVNDESILLILLHPRIIFPDEEEEKVFGSFEEGTTMDIDISMQPPGR
ncbi:MAG: hypothetical protein AMJ79_14530 [Phycisphaerae bacterium SM23_30]|nr:MAG: hypothetical protein AMJ79_14530 [Phycisphaerae bacterium SM23_30]